MVKFFLSMPISKILMVMFPFLSNIKKQQLCLEQQFLAFPRQLFKIRSFSVDSGVKWKIFSLFLIQSVSCRFRLHSFLFTGCYLAAFSMFASTAFRLGKAQCFRRVPALNATIKSHGMKIFRYSAGSFCAENARAAAKKFR